MDQQWFNIFFGSVFAIGSIILIIFALAMAAKQSRHKKGKQKEADGSRAEKPAAPEYTADTMIATVVDQTCCVKIIGFKIPKTVKEFVIVFRTEKGDILKLNVSEEMYDGFEQGQTGVLSIVDGQLYGFELQETK